MSSRRYQKKKVLGMLEKHELEDVQLYLDGLPAKDVANILFSSICREHPVVKWHAVSCMGKAVARIAENDLEEGRVFMRRFLWTLNDESGGIGWGAPESMAEAMCCHRQLGEEYHHMLISYMRGGGPEPHQAGNFLEHALLQRGLLWGICQLAEQRVDLFKSKITHNDLVIYLTSPDPEVQAQAVRAAGLLQLNELKPQVMSIEQLEYEFLLYEKEQLSHVSLQNIVDEFLIRIQ